ncbi:MAG: radical SAM protein [Candidatus Bathycorpusculaceae bacterium]
MNLITPFDPWHSKLCTCPPKLTFNPYTGCDHRCLYCYASSYIPKFYACRPKKDLLARLEREAKKLRGEIVSIANSSDPYPTIEAEKALTRQCLKILARCDCKIQIITKSDLVTRDIDLLAKVPTVVSLTITTEDENLAKTIEPKAPPPKQRLKAIQTLAENGIPTTVRIDPIIPYINENPENLIKTLAEIGVKHVTASTYKVKADNWQRISLAMPETTKKLKPLYFEKGEKTARYTYLPKSLRLKLMENIAVLAKKHSLKFGTCRESLNYLNTAACDGTWLLKKA